MICAESLKSPPDSSARLAHGAQFQASNYFVRLAYSDSSSDHPLFQRDHHWSFPPDNIYLGRRHPVAAWVDQLQVVAVQNFGQQRGHLHIRKAVCG